MFERRLTVLYAIVCIGLVGIGVRLAYLQVFQMTAEDPDAVLRRPLPKELIPACRGPILDRHGDVLAADRPSLRLAVHYREILLFNCLLGIEPDPAEKRMLRRYVKARVASKDEPEREALAAILRILEGSPVNGDGAAALLYVRRWLERISYATGRGHDELCARLLSIVERVRRIRAEVRSARSVYEETIAHTLIDDVSVETAALVESDPRLFPGVTVEADRRRVYPLGPIAPHVLGYIGLADPPQRGQPPDDPGVMPGDRIGITGAEKRFDRFLRGEPGIVSDEVDAKKGLLRRHVLFPAISGRRVHLTLSRPAQQRAEAEIAGKVAAVVVMDVADGELLVVASSPGYDNGDLASACRAASESPSLRPFVSRATQDSVPPGSMIKPIVALAAAASGIGPERAFDCAGSLEFGGRNFRCAGVHGRVTMQEAISKSCNIYFYEVARKIGPQAIHGWARAFGFGRLTGVDLPYEWKGRLPDPARVRGWRGGDTLNLGIGQGDLAVTPLQVVVAMAAIANGGKILRPRILHRLDPPPEPDDSLPLEHCVVAELELPPAGVRAVRAGMRDAVISGTASLVPGLRELKAAVKTGTAETRDPRLNQAWIGGYVPFDAPRYAFAVVVHNAAGHGAEVAGPIAVSVIRELMRAEASAVPALAPNSPDSDPALAAATSSR